MSDQTKTCNLTEAEIKVLLTHYGYNLHEELDNRMERLNYLHKRLKAFKEIEIANSQPLTQGWPTNG